MSIYMINTLRHCGEIVNLIALIFWIVIEKHIKIAML